MLKRYGFLSIIVWIACFILDERGLLAQKEEAERLAKQAEEAAKNRQYDSAVDLYKKSYALSGDYVYLYNIAVLYHMRLNDNEKAYEYAVKYAKSAIADDEKKEARDLIIEIEKGLKNTHGKITVKTVPENCHLWIDEDSEEKRLYHNEVWVRPGSHIIIGAAEGYDKATKEILIRTGEEYVVMMELRPQMATLRVESNIKGVTINLEEERLGSPPVEKQVRPGDYWVRAIKDAKVIYQQKVSLKPGESLIIHADEVKTISRPSNRLVVAKWITIGVGSAAVVAGSVCFGLGYKKYKDAGNLHPNNTSNYDSEFDRLVSNGKKLLYSSYGLWGVGGAAVATGVILHFVGQSRDSYSFVPGLNILVPSLTIRW